MGDENTIPPLCKGRLGGVESTETSTSPCPSLRRRGKKLFSKQFLQEAQDQLDLVREMAAREGKRTAFCIGNTTKHSGGDYFYSPVRTTAKLIAGSVIVHRVMLAEEIAKFLDGKVDYIAVDTEKKISPGQYGPRDVGNIERVVRRGVKKSRLLTFKGNDLTVDAIDCLLGQLVKNDERGLGGKNVAIVGAGNIGFKLALRLVEQGSNVTIVRRDRKKLEVIAEALNYVKPPETIAKIRATVDPYHAVQGAQILIGLTPGTQAIDRRMVEAVAPNAILVDGGKGSFSLDAIACARERELEIYRADIRASFAGRMEMLLAIQTILEEDLGRKKINGVPVVSGGLLGNKDEIVVDSVYRPTRILGVADGCGDFVRDLNKEQMQCIRTIEEYIHAKELKANEVRCV